MSEEIKTRHRHRRLWIWLATGVVLVAVVATLVWYLRSQGFADFIRRKVIARLEQATGGRVEIASFRWNLSALSFEADDLTVHGLEGASQLPFAHVDHAFLRLHIISFFERRISLERLDLQHPVIHVIIYPDGTTNAPEPKIKPRSNKTAVEELFDLAVARADARDGMLLLNERGLPFEFTANDIAAVMTYDAGAPRYDGSVQVSKFDLQYPGCRDIPARADLQLSLWHDTAEVKSLKLTSQDSSLTVSGKLVDFNRPQVQVAYTSAVNLAQLGAIMRTPELRAGRLQLVGAGTYSQAAGYASDGTIAVRNLDYLNDGIALRETSGSSNFAFADNRLLLSRLSTALLGGQVSGEVEIRNFIASPSQLQQGSARLRVSGLSLNLLARMISTRTLPLDKLNIAGAVSGSVIAGWKVSLADAVTDLALDFAAPARVDNSQLPVSGSLRGRYGVRSGRTDLATLNLSTPHAQLLASGSAGATAAALKLAVSAASLSEFQPLWAAMESAPLPVELNGMANFTGTLNGRWRTPQIAGHLEAADFTYLYMPAQPQPHAAPQPPPKRKAWFHLTTAPTPPPAPLPPVEPRRIHIDEFSGDIQYSPAEAGLHHAVVKEGNAQLTIDGTTALDKGNFTGGSRFQVQAAMHNADVSELQRAFGTEYHVSGQLNFNVSASGTVDDPHGHGEISLTDGQARGRPILFFTSKVAFANHAVEFDSAHLRAARGTVTGSGAYDWRTRGIKLDLSGQSIDLAEIPEVQTKRLQTAGVADFTMKASGTADHPVVNARVEIGSLILNGDTLGSLTANAVTHGPQLTLTARSHFPHASFTLDGNLDLRGDLPGSATLRFSSLDVNPFLPPEIRGQVTHHASLDGEAQLSGPLKQPRLLHGNLTLQQFSVDVQHIPLKSEGNVELSFADEVVAVQRCTITSEDTRFTLTGTASLKDQRPLDLRANGSVSLRLAQTLNPDLTSYGTAQVDLAIGGNMADPLMSGKVEVEHAGLSMIDLPVGLGDVNGTLVFNRDRLEVETLTGRMGGGHVKLGGFITYGRTIGVDLTVEGNDIRFRYAGISVTSDQTLRLSGTQQNASLTGNITVTRFAQVPSSDLQFLLAQATTPARVPNAKSPLNNLHLEIRILSTPELTVQTSLAKLSGDVDLRLRGTAERPVLLGRINIAEGDVKIAGTKYHLDRGDVTFLDPVRIDPVLDVEATTRVRDYDITIGLHGTLERLNTTYRSDPPLSSDDIVSLLAFGRTQTETAMGASSPGFAESASGALLSSAINQASTNRVSKIFGVSSIRINPAIGGPDNDPNARVTIEQQVSNNVTFTYITNLARSAQEVIQFEYNVNSEYTVQGIRDENGVVSFDLLIRKRKR